VRPHLKRREHAKVHRSEKFTKAVGHFHRPWREHHRWYHGSWHTWPRYPRQWAQQQGGSALAGDATGETFAYENPYWVNPALSAANPDSFVLPAGQDYSKPIAVPTDAQAERTKESTLNDALLFSDRARLYFKKDKYADAITMVEKALRLLPGDRSIQEFRALTLFADKKYTDAAATIHAVLASGPGWDWDSMAELYADTETYTEQLRGLEAHVRDHPKEGSAHFLLAYHYLVLEEHDAALVELREAARLTPADKLATALADALSEKPKKEAREEG
jgi:tetratricopeptide (TPR) repeat protein